MTSARIAGLEENEPSKVDIFVIQERGDSPFGAAVEANSSMKTKPVDQTFIERMSDGVRRSLGDTKLVVHVLVCVFAIASWADLNGTWSELSQLVLVAKEGWHLPSYITIIGQIANVGPIAFVLVSYFFPNLKPRLDIVVSFVIILTSMVSSLLMAFFWQENSVIFGTEHSTAFLVLTFFLSIGDCTSSVCFYAFMALLKPQYIASLLLGEGLSGMLPALIALAQGASDITCVNSTTIQNLTDLNGTSYSETVSAVYPMSKEPLFSVKVFFIILSGIIACSAVAFLVLNSWSYCRTEFVGGESRTGDDEFQKKGETQGFERPTSSYGAVNHHNSLVEYGDVPSADEKAILKAYHAKIDNGHVGPYVLNDEESAGVLGHDLGVNSVAYSETSEENLKSVQVGFSDSTESTQSLSERVREWIRFEELSSWELFLHLLVLIVINMTLTTFLPTIQIYSVLPYGLEYYHLTTTLTQIANPVACFFALFIMAEHLSVILTVTILGQGVAAFIIYLAASSPTPPLHTHPIGGEMAVTLWIVVTMLLIYAKVCVAGVLRKHGRNALILAGFVTQVGTTIGAVVGFVLVNEKEIFREAPYCRDS